MILIENMYIFKVSINENLVLSYKFYPKCNFCDKVATLEINLSKKMFSCKTHKTKIVSMIKSGELKR